MFKKEIKGALNTIHGARMEELKKVSIDCYASSIGNPNCFSDGKIIDNRDKKLGAWFPEQSVSKMDDIVTSRIAVRASNFSGSNLELLNAPILFIRCDDKDLSVFISWDDYLGSSRNGGKEIRVRRDKEEPFTLKWSLSTDDKATFADKPHDFIKSLYGVKILMAETTPYRDAPILAVFPVENIEYAVQPVLEACGKK